MVLRRTFSLFLAFIMLSPSIGYSQQTPQRTMTLEEWNRLRPYEMRELLADPNFKAPEDPNIVRRESIPIIEVLDPVNEIKIAPIQIDPKFLLDLSMLSCTPSGIDYGELEKLEGLRINCWDNKPFTGISSSRKLFKEQDVCRCLKKSPHSAISDLMKNPSAYASAVSAFQRSRGISTSSEVEQNNARFTQYMKDKIASMGFTASVIFEGNVKATSAFTGAYGNDGFDVGGMTNKNNAQSLGLAAAATAVAGLGGVAGVTPVVPREGNRTTDRALANVQTDATQNQLNVELFKDTFNPESDQCIGSREFLAFRQLPTDQRIFRELSTKPFSANDWDYAKLEARFKDLAGRSYDEKKSMREEILTLKAKLIYLGRNPLLKSFFAAKPSIPEGDSTNQTIRDAVANIRLEEKQRALFEIMKSVIPSSSACRGGRGDEGACLRAASEENLVDKYRKGLKDFFGDTEVAAYSLYQNQLDINRSIAEYQNEGEAFKPATPAQDFISLEADFVARTGLKTPEDCRKNAVDLVSCVETYAPFCQALEASIATVRDREDNLIDNLDVLSRQYFDTNIETNTELQAFNREMCGPRRSGGIINPRTSDFRQFRGENCVRPAGKPECEASAAGYALMRRKFHEAFPRGANGNESRNEAEAFMQHNVAQMDDAAVTSMSRDLRTSNISNSLGKIADYNSENPRNNTPLFQPDRAPASSVVTPSNVSANVGNMNSNNQNQGLDEMGYNPMISSSAAISSGMANLPDPNKPLTEDDKERIRSMAEEEIARNQRAIPSAATTAERERLEQENKALQDLLAQRSDNESKYQQLIAELTKRTAALEADIAAVKPAGATRDVRRTVAPGGVVNNNSFISDAADLESNRAPASVKENPNFNTSGSNAGGGQARVAAAFGGSAAASSRTKLSGANSALLDAAMARGRSSSDGAAVILADADRGMVQAIENSTISGTQFSITVPPQAFAQFQSESVDVLRQYKDQILRNAPADQPVRLTVKNGNQTMNIVVVNRDGKLVYVPSRIFSLKSLNQELQSTRGPAGQNP